MEVDGGVLGLVNQRWAGLPNLGLNKSLGWRRGRGALHGVRGRGGEGWGRQRRLLAGTLPSNQPGFRISFLGQEFEEVIGDGTRGNGCVAEWEWPWLRGSCLADSGRGPLGRRNSPGPGRGRGAWRCGEAPPRAPPPPAPEGTAAGAPCFSMKKEKKGDERADENLPYR